MAQGWAASRESWLLVLLDRCSQAKSNGRGAGALTFDNRLTAAARLALRSAIPLASVVPRPSASPRLAPHRRYFPVSKGPTGRPSKAFGLHPGEPETCRRDLGQFLAIWVHLTLMLAIIKVFRVEGRALFFLSGLAWAALPAHYLLAYRWKKPFFLAVSVVGLLGVFGVGAGLTVASLAVGTIAVARLPMAWGIRAGLVGGLGVGLGVARYWAGSDGSPWSEVVWPVLGSMMMFRMMIYLYEIKHVDRPEPIVDTLGYFFLLPNYCFLHFPVVDYRTLNRSFCSTEIHATQRTGLRMIFNGLIHLLAYRLVYHDLLITPDQVHSPATLAGFVVANYLLYLQVSGQFHLACGMLHLFGYQLPTTHHHYLLASGFTDYWRRVNIYWKDFMVRVVFNPLAFRWKRRPQWQTLSAATSAVFVTTWALHAYQSFWLRGVWGFSVTDGLFWGILGGLVIVNVQLDARTSASRPTRPTLPTRLVRAAKIAATFTTLALLWSLWSSPDLATWLGMFRRAFG